MLHESRCERALIKAGLTLIKSFPFKTVFVIDEANKKSIFAITQNIDLVNESRKRKGGGGGGPGSLPGARRKSAARHV
jgi:hypothetical protein